MIHKPPIILAVTDSQATAAEFMEVLERECALEVRGSGPNLPDAIRESRPDLVLLDLDATAMSVQDLFGHLGGNPAVLDFHWIAVSSDPAAAEAAVLRGATECALKPIHPVSFRNRIRRCLEFITCREALRALSLVDELTGIANRRRFEEFLNMEWRRNFRNQTPLGIILMDLDNFSAYNERHGLEASDLCIQRVASALAVLMQRPGDLIARFGRSGFACVLPETDTVGAVSVAERFRAEVFALAIPDEASGAGSRLTVSLGVATGVPLSGAEPEDLLALAERHLMDAKRGGRNRLVFGS